MKTLADLKRDATSGKIQFELIERYGKFGDEIPKKIRGIRTVEKVNTVAILLKNSEGIISELRFPLSAKLVEYDGETLTIFARGERVLTEQEQKILADWKKIEDDYYLKNPYGDTYWRRKKYFNSCSCPWLAGYETVKGKYYKSNGKVLDSRVRGDAILKYRIYWED